MWGTWPIILRHAPMPAALQSAVVVLVQTIVSGPFLFRDRLGVKATRAEWIGIGWLAVADALNIALFFAAYQHTSVAVAVLTHYLAPIFVALAAPRVLGERANPRTLAAVGIAFLGLGALLQPWDTAWGHSTMIGAALGAGSAVFYASNVVVNKRLSRAFSASEMMFFHGLVATPLLFAFVPLAEYGSVSRRALFTVLGGAIGPGTIAGLMFTWGLRRIDASQASVLTLLEPLVAVALGVALLGQGVGFLGLLGSALILIGAAFVIVPPRIG